ncbi:MAG: tetratricopeptide repeat protein, partial [Chloroflexi bacterium]|nr:tetratricopeptide repeat protein [Chloroflexota bacterium]
MLLNRGQREEPVDANGFHDRGNVYSRHGNYERAVQDYNRAIEMDGDFAEAYYDRGC